MEVIPSKVVCPVALSVVAATDDGVVPPMEALLIVPPVITAVDNCAFILVKLESNSVLVNGDPLPARVTIVAMIYPYYAADNVIVHVITIVSATALFTTANTVRHNISPAVDALNTPASVIAPVPSPAENVVI